MRRDGDAFTESKGPNSVFVMKKRRGILLILP